MQQPISFVASLPDFDVRRLFVVDASMTAAEVHDFVVSKLEFLQRNEKFVLYCDDRRDRSQLFFPETETMAESGVPSGSTIVFRSAPADVYLVMDSGSGSPMTYSLALTHPTRTVVRLDLYAALRSSAAQLAQRMNVAAAPHEYSFCALNDRGLRPLRLALSLHEQQVGGGSVIAMQSVGALLRVTLDSISGIVRAGYLVKKSIKNDKVTKNKKRWCVLAEHKLYYFKSNAGASRPAGVILLECYSVSDKSMSGQFLLQHSGEARGSPDFVLSLETFGEAELDAWKWAIRERCEALPLMGVSLRELARVYGGRPPPLVEACVDQLMQVGPKTEGLFRLSGQQEDIEQLVSDFTFLRNPSLEVLSAHVVAGALKQFLRELPVPLLTWDLHDAFCAAASRRSHDELIAALQRCILRLPALHQTVLELLLGLLEAVDAAADRTLMSARNLSLALTPSILQPPSRDPMPSKEQLAAVTALIVHRSELFASLAELYEEEEVGRPRPRAQLNGPAVLTTGPGGAMPVTSKTLRGAKPPSLRAAGAPPVRPKASDVFSTPASPPPGTSTEQRATVKFPYTARTEKELSVAAGTECVVLKTYPNGWSLIESAGARGIVPSSYVAISDAPAPGPPSPRLPATPGSAPVPSYATVRAPPASPRKVAPAGDVFKKPQTTAPGPPPSARATPPQAAAAIATSAEAEGWKAEAEALRREVEALREALAREKERADAEREAARDMAESVAACRREVERLKLTVNRTLKDKDSASVLVGEKIVELEEEIEVLDTRIDQEAASRSGLEGALMGLVTQLQSDAQADRAAIEKLQTIVDAWSQ